MRVHFVVHEAFETPAAIETWVQRRGHFATYSRVHAGDPLPESVAGIDLLVVMGGPQSPATTQEQCPHFDSAGEQRLIQAVIDNGSNVLGVCLGAQLIGAALGAASGPAEHKEIGVWPITLNEEGRSDPLLGDFPEHLQAAHWHNDMPGLTPEAVVLATSAGCSRQLVRYGPGVYGLQCHLEFTVQSIAAMIENCSAELAAAARKPYVQAVEVMLAHDYTLMNEALFGFLDRLTAQRPAPPATDTGRVGSLARSA